MKKKIVVSCIGVLIIGCVSRYLLYHKSYHITRPLTNVYEIEYSRLPYEVITISNEVEIERFIAKVKAMRFKKPYISTGKGFMYGVRMKTGTENNPGIITFSITDNIISYGGFHYSLIDDGGIISEYLQRDE